MKVRREPLPDVAIDKLVAMADRPAAGIERDEVVGYRCRECEQADEILVQISHRPGCPIGDPRDDICGTDGLELAPEFIIDMCRAGDSDRTAGAVHGQILLFRCRECGQADERPHEIEHTVACSQYRSVMGRISVRADGGK